MSDSLALSPLRLGGPPPTLEARALFRMNGAALYDVPAPAPRNPIVVLSPDAKGGAIAIAPTAEIVVLAAFRAGMKVSKVKFPKDQTPSTDLSEPPR